MRVLPALAGVVFALASAGAQPAGDVKSTIPADPQASRDVGRLVRHGDAAKDPAALLMAARISRQAGIDAAPGSRYSAAEILRRARAFAQGQPQWLALIDDEEKAGSRGSNQGPIPTPATLPAKAVDDHCIEFQGQQPARILARGDESSNLDLYVFDWMNRVVCEDEDDTDEMYCAFTPPSTSIFRIRIRNLGPANQYTLRHTGKFVSCASLR